MLYGVSQYFVIGSNLCSLIEVCYQINPCADLSICCQGTTGHGSLLHENTAGEKIQYIINKFLERRQIEKQKLLSNPNLSVGDVTTINLTKLNVIIFLN